MMASPDLALAAPQPLASGRACFAGEAVALVLAETEYQAADAAELVEIEWEPGDSVVDADRAVEPGAPLVHEQAPENRAGSVKISSGDGGFSIGSAPVSVRKTISIERSACGSLETRGCLAQPHGPDGGPGLTLTTSTQAPHNHRMALARIFDLEIERVRGGGARRRRRVRTKGTALPGRGRRVRGRAPPGTCRGLAGGPKRRLRHDLSGPGRGHRRRAGGGTRRAAAGIARADKPGLWRLPGQRFDGTRQLRPAHGWTVPNSQYIDRDRGRVHPQSAADTPARRRPRGGRLRDRTHAGPSRRRTRPRSAGASSAERAHPIRVPARHGLPITIGRDGGVRLRRFPDLPGTSPRVDRV